MGTMPEVTRGGEVVSKKKCRLVSSGVQCGCLPQKEICIIMYTSQRKFLLHPKIKYTLFLFLRLPIYKTMHDIILKDFRYSYQGTAIANLHFKIKKKKLRCTNS